ncbi:glucose-1-phosphate adenylyltransferase subunit GlgD [Alkalibacterium sp. m-11]|uniref:Glucose-1-phosphate adenylyltransferase subunit GlgD n=1 Tax=Alkalibacterium indicireducens TaxID=398758 RepID=A0ABN1ANJ1_9LACT
MRNRIAPILNLVEYEDKLKPLTNRRPVASLPFACRYRLVDFPFSSLYNAEAESAALFISGSGHSLYDHMRSGSTWGLDSLAGGGVFTHFQVKLKADQSTESKHDRFYYEDHYNYVTRARADYVVMMGSAFLSNIQIESLIHFHEDKDSQVTVVYKKVNRDELSSDTVYSALDLGDEEDCNISGVTAISDVQEERFNLNMETMILSKKTFLDYLYRAKQADMDINVNNFIKFSLESGCSVYGYEYTGYLKVIEDIKSYYDANMDMLDEDNFNSLFYRADPVRTRSKNSAPTYYGQTAMIENAQFANDCEVYGTVKDSLIFRKVKIAENAHIEDSIIMQDSCIEEGAYLKHVILDKHVYVKKGVRLEGTAENPIVIAKDGVIYAEGEVKEE